MNLRKRVIESTIIAVMLTVVTAVTAVMQTASVENVPEPQQETKAVADVQADGSAGIIEELASLGDAATEQASIERADVVVVAEAQEEEPQLSEEQQAWNSKLMADVDDFLYIRSSADGESEVIGKLYKGAAADRRDIRWLVSYYIRFCRRICKERILCGRSGCICLCTDRM